MLPSFPYSDRGKRYHTFDWEMRQRYGRKVVKLGIDAGFTCPNIDGTCGTGGCTYCAERGGGEFAGSPSLSITEQLDQQRALLSVKWPDALYLAYFQAHTNTHTSAARLDSLLREASAFENVVGLRIATRADCLPEEILDCLSRWNERTELVVELGLQTIHDKTAKRINRCHTWVDFQDGYEALRQRNIRTCIHLIDGLPGESFGQMRESAKRVGALHPYAVKLHLLHILRGTKLAGEYAHGEFRLLTREEYISIICDQLELLPAEIVIERLTGDGDRRLLIGPEWSRDKRRVLNGIDLELARRDTFQGARVVPAYKGGGGEEY